MSLSPIALFVYNRPEHTRRTVEALLQNAEARDSDLYVYSDAPKSPEAASSVRKVRAYIHTIAGFRSINIVERDRNWGLADSIIDGVTAVVNKCGRVIVLEDDVVTSPYFLDFMNRALDRYAGEKRIWHVSGWNYPINTEGLEDAFFWRVMNCWGWATWHDRWKYFSKDPVRLTSTWSKEMVRRFTLDGNADFWDQVTGNLTGRMDTWAVFWYATIFEQDGLCLNPAVTYVNNIGLDDSGEYCAATEVFTADELCMMPGHLPAQLKESALAVHRVEAFLRRMRGNILQRMAGRVANYLRAKA